MSIIGKSTKSLRKHPTQGDNLTIPKTLLFAHKFATASSSLDLTNLVVPSDTEFTGWINPTSTEISQAHISSKKANVYLQYVNRPARLIPTLSYNIASDTAINLVNGADAAAGDIILGWIGTYAGNAKAVDAYSIVKTGVLTAGTTDVVTNLPFTYNKYSDQQAGDVLYFLGGQQLFRCLNNNIANDGEYIEVTPSSGSLTNTLRLKTALLADTSYLIVSNGLVAFAPTESWISYVQTMGGQLDVIIADLAAATGNPTSRYQTGPNNTDLAAFGNRVITVESKIASYYDVVLGTTAQYNAGQCGYTTWAVAIAAAPNDGRILVLPGTYTETVSITKPLYICGSGHGTVINGTTTLTSGATYSRIQNLKFGDNVTINASSNGSFIRDCWIASGKTITDSGSANSKLVIEEA